MDETVRHTVRPMDDAEGNAVGWYCELGDWSSTAPDGEAKERAEYHEQEYWSTDA